MHTYVVFYNDSIVQIQIKMVVGEKTSSVFGERFYLALKWILIEKKSGLDGKYAAFIYNENGSGYHCTCEKEIYENHRVF